MKLFEDHIIVVFKLRKSLPISQVLPTEKGTAMSEICRKYGTPDSDPEAIIEEKIEIYLNLVEKELELIPGADETIKTLKKEFSIPTIYNKGGDYSKATLTVNCIKEVTPKLISSLF